MKLIDKVKKTFLNAVKTYLKPTDELAGGIATEELENENKLSFHLFLDGEDPDVESMEHSFISRLESFPELRSVFSVEGVDPYEFANIWCQNDAGPNDWVIFADIIGELARVITEDKPWLEYEVKLSNKGAKMSKKAQVLKGTDYTYIVNGLREVANECSSFIDQIASEGIKSVNSAELKEESLKLSKIVTCLAEFESTPVTARKKEGQKEAEMEREIPISVEEIDEPAKVTREKIELPGEPNAEVTGDAEKGDTNATQDRVNTVIKDTKRLKETISAFLMSSYKLKLSEDELNEVIRKILSALASFVSDITSARIEELAGISEEKK